jgi:hypothetical protein
VVCDGGTGVADPHRGLARSVQPASDVSVEAQHSALLPVVDRLVCIHGLFADHHDGTG